MIHEDFENQDLQFRQQYKAITVSDIKVRWFTKHSLHAAVNHLGSEGGMGFQQKGQCCGPPQLV